MNRLNYEYCTSDFFSSLFFFRVLAIITKMPNRLAEDRPKNFARLYGLHIIRGRHRNARLHPSPPELNLERSSVSQRNLRGDAAKMATAECRSRNRAHPQISALRFALARASCFADFARKCLPNAGRNGGGFR